jgi:hypothetical protein
MGAVVADHLIKIFEAEDLVECFFFFGFGDDRRAPHRFLPATTYFWLRALGWDEFV